MGKKVEKSLSKEKTPSSTGLVVSDEVDNSKANEPYKCMGNLMLDFNELCKKNEMGFIPAVVIRPKVSPKVSPPQPVVTEGKPDKKMDRKSIITVPAPYPEGEQTEDRGHVDGPPKTYVTADKYQYFKPRVMAELEHQDRWDSVTEVYIRGWKIDAPMMEVLRQCWTSLSKLHTINLWNTGLTEDTLSALAAFLPQCMTVKNLILDGNTVKEENWFELITENSLIQNLSLRHCRITDKGMATFGSTLGHAVKSNTKLISLNLSGNMIGDDGAGSLAEGLRMNRSLLSLNLSSNNIGDKGAVRIAEALSRFPLTHEDIVTRRKLLSEKESNERKSEPKSRDSKEDLKAQKKEKEDPKSNKRASSVTEVTKSPSKTKDKKKDKGKGAHDQDASETPSIHEISASVSDVQPEMVDHINPLLEPVEHIEGQVWLPGNRMLINLNLSRNNIGDIGMAALLLAIQYQTTLTFDNKAFGTGLMRLIVNKNAAGTLDSEIVSRLNEIMLTKDPFYKPPKSSETEVA